VRFVPLLAAAVVLLAGCSSRSPDRPISSDTVVVEPHHCTHISGGYRACTRFGGLTEVTAIYRHWEGRWRRLGVTAPAPLGWWRRVVASADGATLLVQWSGECEVQTTYLVSRRGGRPRPLFRGHSSTIAGWTHPGLARVRLNEAIWRKNAEVYGPGMYLVNPKTLRVIGQSEKPARPGC
jgi:hypothetical protein